MLAIEQVTLRPGAAPFDHAFLAGEICVVLGANQSGKTDLCRLIAGLPTRATGRVSIDGSAMDGVDVRQRPVAMVYQAFINYPNLSVAQNIASPLRARRVPTGEIDQRVAELAAKLRLDDLLDRRPHELSGGQQQRLAIARALAKRARVLLLDEPLVNLDFKLREALEGELRELLAVSATVVIYTSSDPRDAFAMGDKTLLLKNAELQQAGTPLSVYAEPASLAAMELLSDPGVNRFAEGDLHCAVRPEHIRVGDGEGVRDEKAFTMLVTALETNGDESIVHGLVEGEEWVARCPGMVHAVVGETLAVSVRSADVVRF